MPVDIPVPPGLLGVAKRLVGAIVVVAGAAVVAALVPAIDEGAKEKVEGCVALG